MKNLWISHKDSFVTWKGGFAFQTNEQVHAWLMTVLRAGEETGVYKIREAPLIDYLYERDGFIGDFLNRRYSATGEINLFGFTEREFREVGWLAYYNREGEVEEGDVNDMGALLAWLRPKDADEHGWSIWMRSRFPVVLNALDVTEYRTPKQEAEGWLDMGIRIELYTDIWFPWVYGMNEENNDTEKRFSNHELARLHTPRLNEFIQTVRQATLDMGGKWEIDTSEPSYTDRTYLFMLSEEGIDLDAPLPAEYSENIVLD